MTVKEMGSSRAFRPPLAIRLLEGARGVRELFGTLPASTALRVMANAAAVVAPTQTRLRQDVSPPLTRRLEPVDQAIAWSIALYRALRTHCPDRALEIAQRIIVSSGVRLMERAFPRLDSREPLRTLEDFVLPALQHAARHGLYGLGPVQRMEGQLAFDITRCHYVEACRVCGVPELARCFCAVDGPFFAGLSRRLRFSCAHRLAEGDPACTFVFEEKGPCA